jgi:hypothetical protein
MGARASVRCTIAKHAGDEGRGGEIVDWDGPKALFVGPAFRRRRRIRASFAIAANACRALDIATEVKGGRGGGRPTEGGHVLH